MRAVSYLAGEAGIRQFLDVGTGLPTANNTHEVAQSVAPDAHIVYVDNDPLVLAHARALLTSTAEGKTRYLDADMNEPATVLEGAGEVLDLSRPVAVLFFGVLGHVPDTAQARSLVQTLLAAMPSGSYLALSDGVPTEQATVAHDTTPRPEQCPTPSARPTSCAASSTAWSSSSPASDPCRCGGPISGTTRRRRSSANQPRWRTRPGAGWRERPDASARSLG